MKPSTAKAKGCKDCGASNLGQGRRYCDPCKEARLPTWKQAELERSRKRSAALAKSRSSRPPKLCESCEVVELPSYRFKFCPECKLSREAASARSKRADPKLGAQIRAKDSERNRAKKLSEEESGIRIPKMKDGKKLCSKCSTHKPLSNFGKNSLKGDGLQSYCKVCNYDYSFAKRIKSVFGITVDQYDEILARQNGNCAICGQTPRAKRLAVDHDHKTGLVRGLLCTRCNHKLLGSAHDSVEILQAAIDYLNNPPVVEHWPVPARAVRKKKK